MRKGPGSYARLGGEALTHLPQLALLCLLSPAAEPHGPHPSIPPGRVPRVLPKDWEEALACQVSRHALLLNPWARSLSLYYTGPHVRGSSGLRDGNPEWVLASSFNRRTQMEQN